ncbi:hypothetical protein C8A03DRAFT_32576 [Achaetomium macrosporum]|uniref:Uncharacterized protein n=1 Tax=Achaetomium macrosporum TaxID=79813 RepID=A0AAN7CCM6_9PEZI|nr:hypothetical protein C8A03DRAFT_32576 [Achaetomium macrosporum]
MFGSRRHRAPNPPLTAATADPNAATAAAAVFKRHESNASLSAAAAAAALRARPTTPTRVADVQTKRTVRRSASVASTRTASEQTRDQSGLQRRGSSGSMTERTFRTPSPHRPGSSGSGHRRSLSYNLKDDMPPVPALPKNMDTIQIRKANSLSMGSSPVRLASQKLASGAAPSWFGAAKIGDLGSVRRTDPAMASPPSSPLQLVAHEEDAAEGARPGSQASSINFSYPARTRRGSANLPQIPGTSSTTQISARTSQSQPVVDDQPAGQASRVKQQPRGQAAAPSGRSQNTSNQELVYDPNSRRMVRQADLLPTQQAVLTASQQRTGSTKKKQRPQRAGSHLAAGTMGRNKSEPFYATPSATRPSRALSQAQPERQVQPAHTIEARPVHGARENVEEPAVKAIISSPRTEAKRVEQQHSQNPMETARTAAPAVPVAIQPAADAARFAVRRQPSVVREEPEAEDAEDERKGQHVISDALDAVPGRRRVHAGLVGETDPPAPPSQEATMPSKHSPGSPAKVRADLRLNTSLVDVSEDGESKPGAVARVVSRERPQSNSPARQAHFGPVQDNLTVKHSPPPRSVSPRKSALKQISPTRGASPSGDSSEASGSANQDPPVARKRSVRVSFEDGGTETVGDSASTTRNDSPVAANPRHANRHSWLTSLGRRPRDLPPLDDDGLMKPRPTLPSFGSVRNRKPQDSSPDQSERPLVRPKAEIRYSSSLLPSPPLGFSDDHAIGPILANGDAETQQRPKHAEETSRHGEPLPPVVTSVEGTGYISDSSDASSLISSEFEHLEASLRTTAPGPKPHSTTELHAVASKAPVSRSAVSANRETLSPRTNKQQDQEQEQDLPSEQEIPTISVSRPTPVGEEDKSPLEAVVNVPGGFPGDDSDHSPTSAREGDSHVPNVAKPADATSTDTQLAQPVVQAAQPTTAEDSSDSESSIYSDAYEDLSEISGDGFQSLNAVVESPLRPDARIAVQTEHPRKQVSSPPEPSEEGPKLQTEISSATTVVGLPDVETPEDEWEKIKAYWKSLTAEKRAQLEREAREEAGIEADLEEAKSEAVPKKQKSIERKKSERKALAAHITQHVAQQSPAQLETETSANPERSYMIKPGERWTGDDSEIPPMRKTMRREPEQRPTVNPAQRSRLRKSMRASGPGASAHEPQMAISQAASKRTVSSPPPAITPTTGGQLRLVTQVESDFQPSLERRGSTGSVSSFKRSRSARAQGSGFRQSMRPMSPPSTQGERRSSKTFSLRALSPTAGSGHAEPAVASVSVNNQMRTTLRGSSAGRKSPTGIRMPFGLSYGGGKKSSSKSTGSRFSSRFADSSDEEGGGGVSSGFRSRFEDSSDDEHVMPTPVPLQNTATATSATSAGHTLRKESSRASTALPEELEESEESQDLRAVPTTAAAAATATTLRRARSGRGQLRPNSQIAPAPPPETSDKIHDNGARTSRRSSIMSVLRHRKKDTASAKVGRPAIMESAARRDTRLERSVVELERIRSQRAAGNGGEEGEGEGDETPVPAAKSPRLQKRGIKRVSGVATMPPDMGTAHTHTGTGGAGEGNTTTNGLSMDVAQQEAEGDFFPPMQHRRSSTSGNLGTRTLGGGSIPLHLQPQRRMSSFGMEVASVDGSVTGSMAGASSTTRKKRFGALRRIFGRND